MSHIGGDRFAANLLVLPHGLYFGRLDPAAARAAAGAAPRAARPRPPARPVRRSRPVQAAEVALRRELAETGIDEVRVTGLSRDGDVTRVVFEAGSSGYAVSVRTTRSADASARLTCKAARPEPVPSHEVIAMAAL